jgi:endonuclease-3
VPAPEAPNTPHVRTIRRVNELLIALYGERQPEPRDPLDGLVLIILSQATNDYNCDRAFASLKSAFPTWDEVLAAPVEAVADAIRSGGLANQKAARIQQLLREIKEDRSELDLSWMHNASAEECEKYMQRFHGVGPKTIACVLVFFLGKPAFPVDTHVFRVTKRLGWIRDKASPDEAHKVLKELIPDDCKLDLHVNLIAHGRLICKADGNGGPRCGDCTIRRFCAYGRGLRKSELKVGPANSTSTRDPDFFVTVKAKPLTAPETGDKA